MKQLLSLFLIFFSFLANAQSSSSDSVGIAKTVNYYLEGDYDQIWQDVLSPDPDGRKNRLIEFINSCKQLYEPNPNDAKIITSDIELFWKAYDKIIVAPQIYLVRIAEGIEYTSYFEFYPDFLKALTHPGILAGGIFGFYLICHSCP